MRLTTLPYFLTVAKYDRLPDLPSGFCSLSHAEGEISLVCETKALPACAVAREDGWRALAVVGPLDFSLVGVLSALSGILAKAKVPLFALSTFDTDYLLVKEDTLALAVSALTEAGHEIVGA